MQESMRESFLTNPEALKEVKLIKGFLSKNGQNPENFTQEQYDWALQKVNEIRELAKNESSMKGFAHSAIRAMGDITLVPVLFVGAVLDLIMDIPLQDRSFWARDHKPSLVKALINDNEEFRKIYGLSNKEELSRMESEGEKSA